MYRRPYTLLLVVCATLIALVACSSGPDVDDVTVTAGGQDIVIPAALMCYQPGENEDLRCAGGEVSDTTPRISLEAGSPIQVQVPQQVGSMPWLVLFAYTDSEGVEQGERSQLFEANTTWEYEITPEIGAELTRLEVQTLTAAPGAAGGVEFPVVGSWVLLIDTIRSS